MKSNLSPEVKKTKKTEKHKVWSPKIWLGGNFSGWLRLLVRNRFAVGFCCLHSLVFISISTLVRTLLHYVQELVWGSRVNNTEIKHTPLFIIGHWRSGTTLLHELLTLDERHTYPTNYECFSPNHFLLTERFAAHYLGFLLPTQRPMDNMDINWESPQEDEFAFCNLGLPSPYLTIAFPNRPPQCQEYFDLEEVPPDALDRWKKCFLRFVKQITIRNPKRIVLKSPTHTYRIKVLLKLFPDARFVHIMRDPYVVFPSTIKMWKALYRTQGLQRPKFEGLEDYVFENYIHMFENLERTRSLIDPSRFYEVRYEDLVRNPIGQLRAIYENLNLGDFERVLPRFEKYLADRADYSTNRYTLPPDLQEKITRRWGEVIRRYGYDNQGEQEGRK